MAPLLQAFLSQHLPSCLWSNDVLYLPAPLTSAHADYLSEKGWTDGHTSSGANAIGGASEAEARDHVIHRFTNSAARMQYVCSDPRDEQEEIRNAVFEQLADGAIHLIDLAAGNGAGTLAILPFIGQLRLDGLIPKLPLNVHIHAIDYSPFALNHFFALKEKLDPWITGAGINVELTLVECDLSILGHFNEALEAFFADAKSKGVKRFLCTVSAITGLKKEGMEPIVDALKFTAAALGHSQRTSSWLWAEPAVGKSWFTALVSTVSLTMKKVAHKFFAKGETFKLGDDSLMLPDPVERKFSWADPGGKHVQSHVVVLTFKNS